MRRLLTLALLLAALGGCKQSTGDRCQLDSDCSCSANGLSNKCVITQGIEGICCEGQSVFDAAPTSDGTVSPDANMSMNPDSSTPDATMTTADASTD